MQASRIAAALVGLVLALGAGFYLVSGRGDGSRPSRPSRGEPALTGVWEEGGGRTVELAGGGGTYADAFGTGKGSIAFRRVGERTYAGSWEEPSKRKGTLSFRISPDGRSISGAWEADGDCAIRPGEKGPIAWRLRHRTR